MQCWQSVQLVGQELVPPLRDPYGLQLFGTWALPWILVCHAHDQVVLDVLVCFQRTHFSQLSVASQLLEQDVLLRIGLDFVAKLVQDKT